MWRLIFLLLPTISFGQDSFNVELLDRWYEDSLTTSTTNVRYNDCWGYTQGGKEFALAGSTEGIHIFGISNAGTFQFIDFVEGKYNSPMVIHRDIKTYDHYAYAVCDEGESSLQIIDLSYLPDSVHVVYENDSAFTRVHNLFVDEDNALLYACSVRPSSGGMLLSLIPMQVYSIANPELPVLLYEGPGDIPEVHDCYVRDNIAYLNCGMDGLRVYDFSNPTTPVFLQNMSFYQDQGYNHQGWMSPDGTRYIFGDESNGKQLKNCTVNANHEVTIKNRFGTNWENESVAHNIMLTNDFAFVAYYNEGLRIYDIRKPIPEEIAFYDTYPIEEELFKMQGAWGVYSQYPSERILVSDRHTGLYLFDFNRSVFDMPGSEDVEIAPNPLNADEELVVKMNIEEFSELKIDVFDYLGKQVQTHTVQNQSYATLSIDSGTGVYLLRISYLDYLDREVALTKRVLIL